MEHNFRPLTLEERFFQELVKIHVPYSLPPEALPAAAVPPVPPSPPINFSKGQFPDGNFGGKGGRFLKENWQLILITMGVTIAISIAIDEGKKYIAVQKNKKLANSKLLDKIPKSVASAIPATEKAVAENAKNGKSAENTGNEENNKKV